MSQNTAKYIAATRHPWACVLFVLPLLLIYEVGMLLVCGNVDDFRNGADTWLRWALSQIGLHHIFWPGVFVGSGLLAWGWWSRDSRPKDLPNVWIGMVIESSIFALILWGLSCALAPLLDYLNLPLNLKNQPEPALQHLVSFLGAGIYEEVLFRLILLTLLYKLFQLGDIKPLTASLLAIAISSLIFAAAHHAGSAGEPFDGYVFLFRCVAGCYFAAILQWRGFGIAVGAHAFYDVLVGIVLPAAG